LIWSHSAANLGGSTVEVASATAASSQSSSGAGLSSVQVSPDQFLKLLIAELSNQDPMNPMDQPQFIGQLAQMQSVSELRSLNDMLTANAGQASTTAAIALLGHTVTWRDPSTEATVSGKVDAVLLTSSGSAVKVGDSEVSTSDLLSVS
jgi:flagellar basal-body rod modification protein FlgD